MGPNGLSVVKFMKSSSLDRILDYCSRVLEVTNKNGLKKLEVDFSGKVEAGAETFLIATLLSLMEISCFPWEAGEDQWPPRRRHLPKPERPSREFLLKRVESCFFEYQEGLSELLRGVTPKDFGERRCYRLPEFRES